MKDDELLAKYQSIEAKLKKYALTLTKSTEDAEDLTQDTFIKIWTKRHLYTEMKMFRAWCFTIMYNIFVSGISRGSISTVPIHTDDERENGEAAYDIERMSLAVHPVNYAFTNMALDEIEDLLGELTEVNRDIVKERISGYAFKEIGNKHGISGDSAKLRYHNSISKLKSKIEKQANYGSA